MWNIGLIARKLNYLQDSVSIKLNPVNINPLGCTIQGNVVHLYILWKQEGTDHGSWMHVSLQTFSGSRAHEPLTQCPPGKSSSPPTQTQTQQEFLENAIRKTVNVDSFMPPAQLVESFLA